MSFAVIYYVTVLHIMVSLYPREMNYADSYS